MDDATRKRVINALRQVSRWMPSKAEALRRAQVRLQIGETKKGKPKYRIFFRCAKCGGLFKREEINVDHIHPAIDPVLGFIDWNTYFARLFCDYLGLQVLCIEHHDEKTAAEREIRLLHRKPKEKKPKKVKLK